MADSRSPLYRAFAPANQALGLVSLIQNLVAAFDAYAYFDVVNSAHPEIT
ncbi:hypothetical protein [Sodalis sp. C49]